MRVDTLLGPEKTGRTVCGVFSGQSTLFTQTVVRRVAGVGVWMVAWGWWFFENCIVDASILIDRFR